MAEKIHVLVVEDDPDGRRSVVEAIEEGGFKVSAAASGKAGVALFETGHFRVVITDLVMPDIDGIEVMRQIHALDEATPVMLMTAYGSVSSSVKALKAGAYDYITKPLDLDDLQSKISRAAEAHNLREEVTTLKSSLGTLYGIEGMVAEDPQSQQLIEQIKSLAATNATVLVQGESGTGKELVARALHVESKRAQGPFVAVNCGALAESLLESELFGHEKGAFTGAVRQHRGAFERADGGTLFLDEIGDAPPAVQVKLLRVLEEREVIRIGGQEVFGVDVRLVSATNHDLEALAESGGFREDLLYRLNVITLEIPPLRERPGDIWPLARKFAASACSAHGRTIADLDASFRAQLEAYHWPGNVRQLRNVMESSVIMARHAVLTAGDLRLPRTKGTAPAGGALRIPQDMTLEEIEREVLAETLRRTNGNRTLTAERLGLSRRTIQRKIKEHDLPY
jgi:DNA-binding NtrC family response regulator